MENSKLHKYGSNITLYNVAINGLPSLSHILIWTYPVGFYVSKCPSATSMYLSDSTNKSIIKFEISGVMWQFTPDSKN